MTGVDEELNKSELGTKEYWDNHYEEELENFRNFGDIGDIWFGKNVMKKIVSWIKSYPEVTPNSKIIDIGCGNGVLLLELFKNGFDNLFGMDYSETAVTLAREIAHKNNASTINYFRSDFLSEDISSSNKFDVILDKGTYDAISLSENAQADCKIYARNVNDCLQETGIFVITSCNWTKSELCQRFDENFEYFDTIETPQMQFGGKVGNVVSCVVFKKKEKYVKAD